MTFCIVRFCGAFACAIQHLLKRSLGKLPLPTLLFAHKHMSWAFGIKRQASQQDTKSPETSEQAIEKLQGFHQLVKDALERAYQQDITRQTEEAKKSYRFAINAIYEGLAVQVPSAWLPGSNVNKLRSNLNSWLQLATDRLRDLESPEPSTSATPITQATNSSQRRTIIQPQRQTKPVPQSATTQRDKQSTVLARQRSAPNRKRETAEEAKLREAVMSEVLDLKPSESWDDIAGLAGAKQALQEMVILPSQRADLFQGLRAPARGLLLYGPPGNGKTMLAKALSREARATFFNISAATLTSKWHGEGEKLVRMLFKVAQENQPAIIFIGTVPGYGYTLLCPEQVMPKVNGVDVGGPGYFIISDGKQGFQFADEIDSILSERSAGEHDASRRLKTEFLVQFDGVASGNDRMVVIGATNRPQELDDAVRRRLVKRIYIPLPDEVARRSMITGMLQGQASKLKPGDIERIVRSTDGYSGSDIRALCREAAMVPIRELGAAISTVPADRIRPIEVRDFTEAARRARPSVSRQQLGVFEQWTREFGTNV